MVRYVERYQEASSKPKDRLNLWAYRMSKQAERQCASFVGERRGVRYRSDAQFPPHGCLTAVQRTQRNTRVVAEVSGSLITRYVSQKTTSTHLRAGSLKVKLGLSISSVDR